MFYRNIEIKRFLSNQKVVSNPKIYYKTAILAKPFFLNF